MEGQEFKPFKPEDILKEKLNSMTLDPAIQSGLEPEPTMDYLDKTQQQNSEWWGAKALWNGAINWIESNAGFVQATMEADIKRQKDKANIYGPEDVSKSEKTLQGLVGIINGLESAKEEYHVYGTPSKFGAALMENAPQLAAQLLIANTAGVGAASLGMFAQIFGGDYLDMRNKGVDHEKASRAAAMDALIQSQLERFGMSGWAMSRTPSVLNKLKGAISGLATEGITEGLQSFPEIFTKMWAENPNMAPEEYAKMFWENRGKYFEEIAMSAAVGAFYGGSFGALNATFRDRVAGEYQKARVEQLGEFIENDKASGATADYIATTTDSLSVMAGNDETAYVSADKLDAFFQTVSEEEAREMASLMGTTVEDVRDAAADGTEIETTIGGIRGGSVASNGALFEAIKEHLSFDLDSRSISTGEAFQKMLKNAYNMDAKQSQELYDTVDSLANQMVEAGMSKELSNGFRTLLISRALTAREDNPAQFFKDNPLRVVKGEDGKVGLAFGQNVGVNALGVDGIKLQQAIQMARNGATPKDIYKSTGWFKGAEGKWRTYIPDDLNAFDSQKIKNAYTNQNVETTIALGDLYKNDKLFKAYPSLADVPVRFVNDPNDISDGSTDDSQITINTAGLTYNKKNYDMEIKSTILHEIQHIIQSYEGFASGGDVSDVKNKVRAAASEIKLAIFTLGKEVEDLFTYEQNFYRKMRNGDAPADINSDPKYQKLMQKAKATVGDRAFLNYEKLALEYERQTNNIKNIVNELSDYAIYRNLAGEVEARQTAENARAGKMLPNTLHPHGLIVGVSNAAATEFNQETDRRLGSYQPMEQEGVGIIRMFDGADASTVIHETGHYFLDAMARDVARGIADKKTEEDLEKLLKYAGTNTQDFVLMSVGQSTEYHEKIAEAFETYLMEGKAPSRELRSIFSRFKKWLLSIYNERKRSPNAVPLTDEVRQVFDSMLACDEALREVEVADGYLAAMYKNGDYEKLIDQLDDKSKEKLKDQLLKVHEKAVEILAKKANASFGEERKTAIKKYQEDILPAVAQEIRNMPLYKSMAMLREFTEIAVNGKGDKADVRAIARRYLNQEGRAFANWQEELKAVNDELNDLLDPVIEDLKSGMGNGVQIVEKPAEWGGGNIYYRVSNNEEWYQNWYSEYGHRPSAYDLRDLAIKNLEGKAGRFTTRSMHGIPDDVAAENEARIKELLARQETLEAQKDKATLGRKKGLSITDMTTFDMVAESNGFATGEELANAILNLPTEKQAIDNRIGELTRNEFPNFWEERSSALEAAREALYSDPNAELIALEEQLMVDALNTTLQKQISHTERMRLARAEASAAKAEARARMQEMTLRKARLPRQFIADERKAAVNAALATSKGDMENALKYKHQQLVAHQMVGLSLGIREAYDRSLRFVKTMAKKKAPTAKDAGYWFDGNTFYAAAELMTRMGLNVKGYNVEKHYGKGDLQNYVNGLREQGWDIFIPDGVLTGELDISRPGTLTVDEYFGAINALKNFRAVANAINTANKDLKAKEWAEVKKTVIDNLSKLKTVWTPQAGDRNKATNLDMAKAAFRSTDNLWEMMDNWAYGYFNKTWGTMLKHCADREAVMINKWDEQTKEATRSWAKKMKDGGIDVDAKTAYADLGVDANENPVTLTRHHLVGMLCYLGSRSGMERLCGTPIVGVAQSNIWVSPDSNSKVDKMAAIEKTRDNLLEFLGKHTTKADVAYAQQILDMCDQYWPELQSVNLRTIGFAPDKVEATALAINTIDGGIIEMRGGYCPLVRNGDGGSHPFNQDRVWNLNTNEMFKGKDINTMNTTTAASSNRTNASYPVDVSQGWFDIPIRDTVHDICYREAMQDFKKLFNDDEIYGLLRSKLGIATTAQFREMLQAAAQPYGGPSMNLAEAVFSRAFNAMRRMTVHAAILGNFKTAAQNISNMYLFGNTVEGFTYADVTAAIFGHFGLGSFRPGGIKALDALCSKSVFFKEREKFLDFSVRDIVQKSKLTKIETETMRWGTAVLVATDNLTAKPVWAMAYTKKIKQGATEQEAIDFADTVIRRTLGSSRIQDVSSVQRGGPFLRLFTTFQSFFNTQYNQWAREYNIAAKMISEQQYADAAFRVTTFLAAKYLFVCLVSSAAALANPFGNDDDDEDKPNNLQKELMLYPMSMLGPAGQASNVFIQKMAGIRSYGYKMTAAQSAVDRYTNLATPIKKAINDDLDSWQDLVEPAVGATTFYFGIPDQINKLFWNAWDIVMNDMDPEWGDLMRRRPKRDR